MTAERDSRFAELDCLIAESERPKFRRTMSVAALDANRRNGALGIIGKFHNMTETQRHRHGKHAQRFRVYRVTCSCGNCPKCRHRVDKREYNRRVAAGKAPKRQSHDKAAIPHGTFTGYNKRGCRCQACRDCVAANARRRRGIADAAGEL